MIDKIISEMKLAKDQYALAKDTNIGIAQARERMKNIAFNYFGELLDAAIKSKELGEKVDLLNLALEDSDKELAELKKKKKKNDNEASE